VIASSSDILDIVQGKCFGRAGNDDLSSNAQLTLMVTAPHPWNTSFYCNDTISVVVAIAIIIITTTTTSTA
jgi:hypothetical protein